jgi:opacity protein-like surface antigen
VALVTVCLLCLLPGLVPGTIAVDDSYIAGYAAAVLRHEFHADNLLASVHNGVVTVDAKSLGTLDRTKVQTALERIPGVIRVEMVESPDTTESPKAPPPEAVTLEVPQLESKFLPRGLLVAPFHADPRWPHFSAAFRHVSFGTEPEATGSANFGETFALYRSAAPLGGQWELSIQAGVFSVFDMRGISTDLQNADYTAGLLASYRTGPFSGFLRLSHQSSHLGDEFILFSPTPVDRVNLSFEEVDLKLSYELSSWFRVYGGGGILVSRDPNTLGIGTSQFGAELTSPWTWLNGKIRPVAYGDFQVNERSNWAVSRSLMAGLQFENARIGDRRLQVLVEYFKGPSPNGQFFTQSIEWIGLGLHLYY